jgi:hypothetical protein
LLARHLDGLIQAKGTATFRSRVQQTSGHRPGLPWKHPAVVWGLSILVVGIAAIHAEERLKEAGQLAVRGGAASYPLSLISLAFWTWLLVRMIACPDDFIGSKRHVIDFERDARRERIVSKIGYALQILSLAGALLSLVHYGLR